MDCVVEARRRDDFDLRFYYDFILEDALNNSILIIS